MRSPKLKLPIDDRMADIVAAVRDNGSAVIQASPGAGKTTRVPPAMLELLPEGEILVLEPRRLAARLAATRVAEEMGQRVGQAVGYKVRFDQQTSSQTRLCFVTEGVLVRQFMRDPLLSGVSAVILDELHERHLHTDLALALLERLRRTQRPELKLIAMSATLDVEPVTQFLNSNLIACDGRMFDINIEHQHRSDADPLAVQVASAVRRLCQSELKGHILVFLPGAADIRRTTQLCRKVADQYQLRLLPLHGRLPAREQDEAVRPSAGRKLILATNVAETSITIDGVAAVIDSGLAKFAIHSPWSGLSALETRPISQASARQRAGRAGRTQAGRCLRLFTARDYERRPAFDPPEISRGELAELALTVALSERHDPTPLQWLAPPPPVAMSAAQTLLSDLGALDAKGLVTKIGVQMAKLPVHPRLARVLIEAQQRGIAGRACLAVALLSEGRTVARTSARSKPSTDLWTEIEHFEQAQIDNFSQTAIEHLALDRRTVQSVERTRKHLLRQCGASQDSGTDEALGIALLAGYPDRVAKRSQAQAPAGGAPMGLALCEGGRATLRDQSALGDHGWCLLLDAQGRENQAAIALRTVAMNPDWLIELFPERITEHEELNYNQRLDRVDRTEQLRFGQLVLEETTKPAPASPTVTQLLVDALTHILTRSSAKNRPLQRWLTQARYVKTLREDFPSFTGDALQEKLFLACDGRSRLEEIGTNPALQALQTSLDHQQRRLMAQLAPNRLTLPSGREVEIDYSIDGKAHVASYLQDFFGMGRSPELGGQAIVVHLWAPNGRDIQVTHDLPGFWERHYPALRKTLSRRYPKHHWPENPQQAKAHRLKRHAEAPNGRHQ